MAVKLKVAPKFTGLSEARCKELSAFVAKVKKSKNAKRLIEESYCSDDRFYCFYLLEKTK